MNWPSEPVILEGVSAADYYADRFGDTPTLSRSIGHTGITYSWEHAAAEHPRLPGSVKPKANKTLDAGQLHHAVILGGEESLVVLPPQYADFKKDAARAIRDEAWACGLAPIIEADWQEAQAAAEILRPRICAAVEEVLGGPGEEYLVLGGDLASVETHVRWSDFGRELVCLWEERGRLWSETPGETVGISTVRCRARWDLYLPGAALLADMKCVTGGQYANAAKFIRNLSAEEDSGAMQAASYPRGLEAVHLELAGRTSFVFLRVEIAPPYAVVPIVVTGGLREHGERLWERAVAGWARCMASGTWPGPGVAFAQLMPWAAQRDLDQAQEDGDGGI